MRFLINFRTGLLVTLLTMFASNVVVSQDLNQQKQEKIKQISEIDKQLAGNPSAEEYDELIRKREKLESEIKEITAKLMADADAMKKINAVKKAYNDGNNAYKLGQYQEAIGHYDKALTQDSTFFKAYYGKGLTLKKLRKYADAIKAYKGAIRHNPSYTEAYVALGKIYSQTNQPDNAIKTYNAAVEYDPQSYKAYYELGAIYLDKKKDYNKAAQNFTKATQINPNYDLAFYSLGVSLTELRRYDEALLALDNALAVTARKKWHTPYYRMAVIYNKQGNSSKAKQAADEALKRKRNYAPAAFEAGKASKDLGQFNQAIDYFKIAAKNRQWKRTADYEIDLIVNRDKYGGN